MTKVRDNPDKGRFELDIGGQVVFARYARHGSVLVIPHVEAPPALRGTGAASQPMAGGMEIARTEGLKVRPLCSYASVWMPTLGVSRPAWLIAEWTQGSGMSECLHCEINQLVQERMESGHADLAEIASMMVESLADLVLLAPESEQPKLIGYALSAFGQMLLEKSGTAEEGSNATH